MTKVRKTAVHDFKQKPVSVDRCCATCRFFTKVNYSIDFRCAFTTASRDITGTDLYEKTPTKVNPCTLYTTREDLINSPPPAPITIITEAFRDEIVKIAEYAASREANEVVARERRLDSYSFTAGGGSHMRCCTNCLFHESTSVGRDACLHVWPSVYTECYSQMFSAVNYPSGVNNCRFFQTKDTRR